MIDVTGKGILFTIIAQLCSNGWWYCATQTETLGSTPFILIPVTATGFLGWFLFLYMIDNWD